MRRFSIVDKTCGNVDCTVGWGDERDLPDSYPLHENQEVVEYNDDNTKVDFNSCYNPNTQTFTSKLKVQTDFFQISHINGTANITITYPSSINETCHFSIDGQSVDVDVVNGTASVPFSSQVTGIHTISVSSSSFYGKAFVSVEVI